LSVDFFFALSGFVLMHVYGRQLAAGMSPAQFMRKRLLRLFPMLALGVLLGAASQVVRIAVLHRTDLIAPVALSVLLNAAFLPSLFMAELPDEGWPLNVAHWSLSFEMLASAAFGIALFRLRGNLLAIALLLCGLALFALGLIQGELSAGVR